MIQHISKSQMDDSIDLRGYEAWLLSRPRVVREILQEVPPRSRVYMRGSVYWVVGATEQGQLILSDVDPVEDYALALSDRHKHYICFSHVKEFLGL